MNVRFTSDVRRKIDEAAQKFGLTKSAIVKLATGLFVDDFAERGFASLPANWQDVLHELDGRTHRYGPGGSGHRRDEETARAADGPGRAVTEARNKDVRYAKAKRPKRKKK